MLVYNFILIKGRLSICLILEINLIKLGRDHSSLLEIKIEFSLSIRPLTSVKSNLKHKPVRFAFRQFRNVFLQ